VTQDAALAFSWPDLLTQVIGGGDLTLEQARLAMTAIFSGEVTPVQLAGLLVALRSKGETVAELRGLADVMLEFAHRIEVPGPTIDIVGTGGDRSHSVNISTMSAIVAAATGLRVVKHGNRAASSSSGSADVLEALGVNLTLSPDQVAQVAQDAGITFCFAQAFHPAMRHAAAARRELGIGTAFNVLGPLTNPAQPHYAAVGVADSRMAPLIAGVFADRGRPAAVFRGDDGLDEVTIATSTTVWWVSGGTVTQHTLTPDALGVAAAPLESLRGGEASYNAQVARDLLAGASGPVRDAVLVNTGLALAIADLDVAGTGLGDDATLAAAVRAGMSTAAAAIDDGRAAALLERWVAVSSQSRG
jgi:anthranilate phosphoribosyltransferase